MSFFHDQSSTSSAYSPFATMQVTRQRARILPSIRLAWQLRACFSNESSPNEGALMCTDGQDSSQALVVRFDRNFRPALESILPSSAIEQPSASPQHGDQLERLSLMHTKLLVYACMNHMTFLHGQISSVAMYDYLKPMLSFHLFHQSLTLSAPRDFISAQSMRAMAESMFRWAVEVGDQDTVARLMALPEAAIDVNNMVCGDNLTPVERSASLGHLELTRNLILLHNADVNKSLGVYGRAEPCQCGGGGALHAALYDYESYGDTTSDLMNVIIKAGGTLCTQDVHEGLVFLNPHVRRHFLSLKARTACTKDWLHSGVFHEAAFRLDSTAALLMLGNMVSRGIGLAAEIPWNFSGYGFHDAGRKPLKEYLPEDVLRKLYAYVYDIDNDHEVGPLYSITPHPATIIDIVAQRGHLSVLQRLKQLQVEYTNDTLVAAVRSRDLPTVRYVLANGAPVDCFSGHYLSTPLAEAIQCGFAATIPLLLNRLDLARHLSDNHHYCALLGSAAQTGDWTWLNYLLTMTSRATGPVMGYALIKAAKSNQTQVVLTLLNAGASLGIESVHSVFRDFVTHSFPGNHDTWQHLPLLYALWNRNSVLVEALLNHRERETRESWAQEIGLDGLNKIIGCAVLWHDDCAIFDELIQAGWSVDCGLLTASHMGKLDLVMYFLKAEPSCGSLDQALDAAVNQGHVLVARELSRRGARLRPDLWRTVIANYPDLLLQFVQPAQPFRPDVPISVISALIDGKREDVAELLLDTRRFVSQPHMLLWAAIDTGASEAFITAILRSNIDLDGPIIGTGRSRETLLLTAIRKLNLRVVLLLLRNGAEVNRPALRGLRRTPLQQAAELGSREIVELLLKNGADVRAAPAVRGGVTSIQAAAIGGFIGIVELLINQDEDFRAPGAQVDGRTALEGAAEHGRFDMVVYLTDLSLYDIKQHERAIRFAETNGHQAIARVLEEDLNLIEAQSLYDTSVDSDADAAATSKHELQLMISRICKDSENPELSETPDMDDDDIDMDTLSSSHLSGARIVDLEDIRYGSQICEPIDVSQVITVPLGSPANHRNVAGTHRMHNSMITDLDMTGSIIDLGDRESLRTRSNNFAPEKTFEQADTSAGTLTLFGASGFNPANPGLRGIDDTSNEMNDGSLAVEDHETASQEPTGMDWQRGPELVEPPQPRAPSSSVEQQVNESLHGKKFKCTQLHCDFEADRNDTLARSIALSESLEHIHLLMIVSARLYRKVKHRSCARWPTRSTIQSLSVPYLEWNVVVPTPLVLTTNLIAFWNQGVHYTTTPHHTTMATDGHVTNLPDGQVDGSYFLEPARPRRRHLEDGLAAGALDAAAGMEAFQHPPTHEGAGDGDVFRVVGEREHISRLLAF